ncbi:hypothetical protein Cni_G13697 [Canna indica]|uniref:Uncharacterized protein n=1 Tax=Canna indica TaxID=4628 RepID=A0AAQ3KAC9_9LILI|nr:hypothetical protein Cni_G13697 [Canna indica]
MHKFEVKELLEKLKSLEEPLAIYREQAVEASERVILLEAELGANAMKLVTVENIVDELKQKNLDTNLRCKNSFAENEVLAASNSKLKEELVAH